MGKRRLGALIGAAVLMFAVAGVASAAAPQGHVTVTKTADPQTVPAGGASVTFTITVKNDSGAHGGSEDFKTVIVSDTLQGCALSDPAGTGAPDTLADGDTWTYTCTVTGVTPGTTNTANVLACKDASVQNCNNDNHDATGSADVTVTLTQTAAPSATLAPTDAITTGSSGPSETAWLLVIALGVLLGSVVILRPSYSRRQR